MGLKESVTDEVTALKEVDLGILEAYTAMPKDLKDKLSFNEFYKFYRLKIDEKVQEVREAEDFEDKQLDSNETNKSEWLKKLTPEQLADDFLNFIKQNELEKEDYISHHFDSFLNSNNIRGSFELPLDLRFKVQKAENIATAKHQKGRLENDKKMLPRLVDSLVNYAQENKLNKITKEIVSGFLAVKEVQLTPLVRDMLWHQAKMQMQSRNQLRL